jgi:hypothetical protein
MVCSFGGKKKKVKVEPAARDGPGEAGSVLARAWDGHPEDADRIAHLLGRLQHTLTDEWHLEVRRSILPKYSNIEAEPSTDAETVQAEACFTEAIALVAFAAGNATWTRLHGRDVQPMTSPTNLSTAKPPSRPVESWATAWSWNSEQSWLPVVADAQDRSSLPGDTASALGSRTLPMRPYRTLSLVPLEFAYFLNAASFLYLPPDQVSSLASFFPSGKTLTRRELECVAEATARALACAF